MAVSGSTDFNLEAAEVIQEAYERCGLQEISGKDLRTAVRTMNILMSEWANRGLNLWTVSLGTQSTTASDSDYDLDTNIIDILEVNLRDANNLDTTLTRISRADYHMLPNKSSEGKPSQFYFERTTTPTLFLYPAADAAYTVVYYAMLRMKDSGDYTNNNEIPFSFLPCLTAGLAYYLALKYAPDRTQVLKILYEEEFKRAADTNRGNVSSHFVPHVNVTAGTY